MTFKLPVQVLTDTTPSAPINGRTIAVQIVFPYDGAAVLKLQWEVAGVWHDIVGAEYTKTTSEVLPLGVPLNVQAVLSSIDAGQSILVYMEAVPST